MWGVRWKCLFLSFLFSIVVEVLGRAIRQEKKIKGMCIRKQERRTSLEIQWMGISLPVLEAWVQILVQEDCTRCGAMKPVCCDYWSLHAPESVLCNERSPHTTARVALLTATRESPSLSATREKPTCSNEDPVQPKIKWILKKNTYKITQSCLTFCNPRD